MISIRNIIVEWHSHVGITKWNYVAVFYFQRTINLNKSSASIAEVLQKVAPIRHIVLYDHVPWAFFRLLNADIIVIQSLFCRIAKLWLCPNNHEAILFLAKASDQTLCINVQKITLVHCLKLWPLCHLNPENWRLRDLRLRNDCWLLVLILLPLYVFLAQNSDRIDLHYWPDKSTWMSFGVTSLFWSPWQCHLSRIPSFRRCRSSSSPVKKLKS